MEPKPPFLSVEYSKRIKRKLEDPLVKLEIVVGGIAHAFVAYTDTGCDSALGISKETAERIGLTRTTDQVHEISLADGTVVGAYLYDVTLRINGKMFQKLIPIVDHSIKVEQPRESKGEEDEEEPLLGRGILDDFNVTFQAKSAPKKLLFEE